MPSIDDEQRRAWIAAAVASSPMPSAEFLAKLQSIPEVIHTRTTGETLEVMRQEMAKPRRFRIHRMEDGIRTKIAGQRKSFLEAGRTFLLWKCNEEQTNLI